MPHQNFRTNMAPPGVFSRRFIPCPRQIKNGSCDVDDCPYQHKLLECEPCKAFMTSQHSLRSHLNGKRHAKTMQQIRDAGSPLPGDTIPTQPGVNGSARLEPNGTSSPRPAPSPAPPPEGHLCEACHLRVPSMEKHLRSARHAKSLRFLQYKAVRQELESDKHGIEVGPAGTVDFGLIDADRLSREYPIRVDRTITIENIGGRTVRLAGIRMASTREKYGNSSVISKYHFAPVSTLNDRLRFGEPLTLTITFDPDRVSGRHSDTLELIFDLTDVSPPQRFKICRPVLTLVTDPDLFTFFAAATPYVRPVRPARPARPAEKDVIPGPKPPPLADIQWKVRLPYADVPEWFEKRMMRTDGMGAKIKWLKGTQMPAVLNDQEYADYWQKVLWIEEVRMKEDIRLYDIKETFLEYDKGSRAYLLKVEGLMEKRPWGLIGDSVLVRPSGETGRFFDGRVHHVLLDKVKLVFHSGFKPLPGTKVDVQFSVNRNPLRRMHAAVSGDIVSSRMFFPRRPEHLILPSKAELKSITFFDRKMETNDPQRLAVAAILHRRHHELPFIIFGPPGTGKTSVVVEAVRQLLQRQENRVLVCAPSNSAADLLAYRLRDIGPRGLFRLCAPSRALKDIKTDILDFTLRNENDVFCVPVLEKLEKYRVVVSTCISASALSGIGIEPGHYTHVVIDEAGQALEPESAIPIKTLLTSSTEVVLAGDPKQLGPIIRSGIAEDFGLGKSLLVRLSDRAAYSLPEHQGTTICKLVKNYRSHPGILKFPNEEFYNGELEANADPIVTHSLVTWDELPNRAMPCIFHNITGEDKREGNSPSFFNPCEVAEVKRYVTSLLVDNPKFRLTGNDIGIITPYSAQKTKIRNALVKAKLPAIKVGSVEEFQGQERRIIILSTVRSNEDYLSNDIKYSLGFVANPRRFNVAITRAQAALVIVGDAKVLKQDNLWLRFMNYLHNEGCWKGVRPDWDTHQTVPSTVNSTIAGIKVQTGFAVVNKVEELISGLRNTSLDGDEEEDALEERIELEEAAPERDWRDLN